MSTEFSSIWLEHNNKCDKPLKIGGFYREWSRNGNKLTENEQVKSIETLTEQMEQAVSEQK